MTFPTLARSALASCSLALSSLGLAACAGAPEPADFADAVYWNGVIHTGNPDQPRAEAVAVKGGAISAVGARTGIEASLGPDTVIHDLAGAAMYPGFVDSHAHLLGIGMRELTLNLEGVGSIGELVSIVAAEADKAKAGAVIYGRGWIETGWPEGRMPSRADLDPVSPDNPVILFRADGHALVANSAAIKAAGVVRATPDPDGGKIERDRAGEATGVFIDNAMPLVARLVSAPTMAQKREAYRKASAVYTAYGWTGVHNMSVDPDDVALIEEMSDAGEIKLRVYNAVDKEGLAALAQSGPRASNNARAVTRAIKLYADGALGSRGAALHAPYADRPDTSGLLLIGEDEAQAIFDTAIGNGLQIAMHAIGDKGNTLVLDWMEQAFARNADAGDLRWRIEHAQIIRPADISRFASLGVIASMQPSHAIGDLYFAPDRLGPDRLDGAYAWRSLLDAGAVVAGGSDAPVERGDPRIEFYAAVARRGLDGTQTQDWRPGEAVTREEALAMFTAAPAYASFQETLLGTIEPGKRADFTVFADDIMDIGEQDILAVKPVMTVVDGEVVYAAD